jgi:DHA3 family macrolide efflux protein-like MFS transporter
MWKKRTAIFISSQACSLLGSSLVQYALFWYVMLQTRSGVAIMVYIVCGFLPAFLLSPFGGVWADRYNRKHLIMIADGFIAFVTLVLALVFMTGEKGLTVIMVTVALRAAGTAVQGPAIGAILPQLVPFEHLTRVNGISQTMQSVITLISPLLSGVLFSLFPLYVVFMIDVVTAAAAIVILRFFLEFSPDSGAAKDGRSGYYEDMKLGFQYIKQHRYLISFFSFLAMTLFLITPAAMLSPLQVTRTFGSDVWRLTAIEIAFSGGMMIGGFTISAWGGFRNRVYTILCSTAVMAAGSVSFGFITSFPLYLAVMVLIGIATPFYHTPSAVMIQEHVEDEYLGRIFSVNTMLFTSVMPLGLLIFGPLAEVVRIESIMAATGTAMLVLAFAASMQKRLVEAGIAGRKEIREA